MAGIRLAAATAARPRTDRTPRLLRITVCSPPARAAIASPSTLRRGTAYRLAPARVTAAPDRAALIPPGRQPAGELLVVAAAGFPVAGTSDSVLAGLSART